MNNRYLDIFYTLFQGALVMHFLLFLFLFAVYKKREFLYYCCYLLLLAAYYFLNAPGLLLQTPSNDPVLKAVLKYTAIPLVMLINVFYLLFLHAFFSVNRNSALHKWFKFLFILTAISFVLYVVVRMAGISLVIMMNIINIFGLLSSLILAGIVYRQKIPYGKFVATGMFIYIIGSIASAAAVMYRMYNPRFLFAGYTLFFVKMGVLADMILYFFAISKKWIDSEKRAASFNLEKKLEVEKVKNTISQQLHDDIGSTLSGINMYSHMAISQEQSGKQEEVIKSLQTIQENAAAMIDRLKDMVWRIQPGAETFATLAEKIEEYAVYMTNSKNILLQTSFDNTAAPNSIGTDCLQQLFLTAKESINNAVKYSNATQISVTVNAAAGLLVLSVTDNGTGFTTGAITRGNGIKNMQQRATECGGHLIITSSPGKGTHVLLKIPVT